VGDWLFWLILAGRGFGKTRTGAQWVMYRTKHGPYYPIALVGQTKADVRDTMIEMGEGSILRNSPPDFRPKYEPSKRRLNWPNGMVAIAYSGDEPDQFRGPQHGSAWIDELAKFKYPRETMDNLEMGLRLGSDPRGVITTTPKPIRVIRDLLADEDVVVTTGSSYENITNLSPVFIKRIIKKYEGTTLGQQELHAQMLDEAPGALWTRKIIDRSRRKKEKNLVRIAVAADPSIQKTGKGDACGIGVVGIDGRKPAHGYVLGDYTLRGGPGKWAKEVVRVYKKYRANMVVAEGNQGGELVRQVIHQVDAGVPVAVVYASHSKQARAEPVVMLYEQDRVHHVGVLAELEDEMVTWVPGEGPSPNRVDWLVWGLTELMVKGGSEVGVEVF